MQVTQSFTKIKRILSSFSTLSFNSPKHYFWLFLNNAQYNMYSKQSAGSIKKNNEKKNASQSPDWQFFRIAFAESQFFSFFFFILLLFFSPFSFHSSSARAPDSKTRSGVTQLNSTGATQEPFRFSLKHFSRVGKSVQWAENFLHYTHLAALSRNPLFFIFVDSEKKDIVKNS